MSLLFNGKNTKNTLKESTTFYSLSIANLQAGLFVRGLFSQPASGEFLLHVWRDKDTAFTVLGSRAAVKTDACSIRYLPDDGKEPLELGRLRHTYSVY